MKYTSTRRVFLKKLSLGLSSAYLTFSVIRPVYAMQGFPSPEKEEDQLHRISPAYQMNVFADGSVELYTHKPGGERIIHQFEDIEADILIKLSKREDPRYAYPDLGVKHKLDEEAYVSTLNTALQSMQDQGFIYKGKMMQVKVRGDANEE